MSAFSSAFNILISEAPQVNISYDMFPTYDEGEIEEIEDAAVVIVKPVKNMCCDQKMYRSIKHMGYMCEKCGKVEEFFEETIEKCQNKVAERLGYKITDHSLYIYGVCPECQKKN